MPKIIKKLADTEVRKAKPKEKPYKLCDEGGLRLLIRPTGVKVWQYPYSLYGKYNTCTIGQYWPTERAGYYTLAEARKVRDQVKAMIQQGIDPNRHKLKLRSASEEASQTSFETIAREWHSKGTWVEKHSKNILKALEDDVFPLIGQKQIDKVTTQDVIAVIRP